MKQSIWIINNYMIWLSIAIFISTSILKQDPPILKLKTYPALKDIQKKKLVPVVYKDKILKNDLFNTYSKASPQQAIKKNLVTPIPQPRTAQIKPPPEQKKQSIVAPLPIKLKGIVLSSNDLKSIVIIEDETKKEKNYHIGDKIKDAQIIKIARNKITILRASGHQETLLLRIKSLKTVGKATTPEDKWKYTIKKIDSNNFEIDPTKLSEEMPTLASLIESLSLGTAFEQGNIVGIKVGKVIPNEIGEMLGLQKDDIIKTINESLVSILKNRVKIYKKISKLTEGDNIKLSLSRNNIDTIINYKLTSLRKPLSIQSQEISTYTQPPLEKSKDQQREKNLRDFSKQHSVNDRYKQTITEMRKRWMEKIKKRSPNTRFR